MSGPDAKDADTNLGGQVVVSFTHASAGKGTATCYLETGAINAAQFHYKALQADV